MKHKLIIFLFVMALIVPQTTMAQENYGILAVFHKKYDNPNITADINPENIIKTILDEEPNGDDYMLWEDSWLEVQRKVTDRYGNVHVTYDQMFGQNMPSDYQLVLHFRPDGSLYYRNGTLAFQQKETVQNAKSRNSASRISAERAAVIATGSPMSETVRTIANHKGKIREAFKVKDMARMQYVYVDAYSGEVLYTISLIHSFAPWNDVKGSVVALPINTSYNGLQELTMMQTDKGYILRDPHRNIVTVDATDILADRDTTNLPEDVVEQFMLLMDSCGDVSFADKAELLNQKYTTSIRSVTFWLDPKMENAPDSLKLRVFYRDKDRKFVKDIIDMDVKNIVWTDDNGRKKCTIIFEDRPTIDLIEYRHSVELTINGELYDHGSIICSGNRQAINLFKGDDLSNVECCFDVEADARQLAIDVHWAIQKIYDMYEEYFGIKGCDGEGCQIVNIVNPSNNMPITNILPDNAFAAGGYLIDSHGEMTYIMCYGAGRAGYDKPQTCFDVTAHEFTHNVTAGCCNNLLYQNESGALNEALADCMAMVAEYYLNGESDWGYCENIALGSDNVRSLSNPWYSGSTDGNISNENAQPKYYHGRYWFDPADEHDWIMGDDNGGVHFNSGVFNHLFYLLCEGGMGLTNEKNETRDIYPVGMDRMKDILFHDMRYYNACLCDYAEIADNLMMAIEDIYGDDNEDVSDIQSKFLTAYSHVGMAPEMIPTSITTPLASTHSTHSTAPRLHLDSNGRIVIEKDGRVYNIIGGRVK